MYVVTDDEFVSAGDDLKKLNEYPYTRWCMEDVSEEMFRAISKLSNMPEHLPTVSALLYEIVTSEKGVSNN